MRIIVSDSSCLIDLRKAELLEAFFGLPYEILIPNTLFEDELLKFTAAQKRAMLKAGLKVIDLPGESVLRAREVLLEAPKLSIHDGFAFVLAEAHEGCILVTGDGALRALAREHSIEVHGVFWIVDEIYDNGLAEAKALRAALKVLEADDSTRLPRKELTAYMKRYSERK